MFKVKKVHYLSIALMSCISILKGATQSINLRKVVKEGQDAVDALITKVGVDYQDQDGTTLAMWATCFNNRKLLRFLVNDKKADLTKKTYKKGNTALIIALEKICNREIELATIKCLEELASKNIDIGVNTPNKKGDTPLLKAIYNIEDEEKLLKVIETLVKSGANVTRDLNSANTPLVLCCDKGYKHVVKYLLGQDNRQDYLTGWENGYGDTPLTMAATRNYPDLVKMLCEKLNLDDNKIKAGIEAAVKHFNFEIAAYLIDQGDSSWGTEKIKQFIHDVTRSIINSKTEKKRLNRLIKVLHFSKIKQHFNPEEIKFYFYFQDLTVLEDFSFLEYLIYGMSPGYLEEERLTILDMIIKEEKINLAEKGNTLMLEAAKHKQVKMFSYLLEQQKIKWKAEHKEQANKLLLYLLKARNHTMIREIIKIEGFVNLIDLNSEDSRQKTLLYYLVEENWADQVEVLRLLADAGKFNLQGEGGKQVFFISCATGNIQLLQHLLDNGIDPKITNSQTQNGVMVAVRQGREKIIKLLMDSIEDRSNFINAEDEKGITALMLAKNSSILISLLREYKPNTNQQNEAGETALMVVALQDDGYFSSHSKYSLIRSLVEESPDPQALINAQNEDGMTVLMLLAQEEAIYLSVLESSHQERERANLQIIRYLVENNANTQLKNKDNKTAYDLALETNHQEIAAYLQSLAPTNIERNQNDGDNGQVGGSDNSTQANDDNSQGGVGNDNSTQADGNSQGVDNDNSIQTNMNNYQGTNRDNSIEPNDRNNRGNNHHVPNRSSNDSLRFLIVVGIISITIAIAAEVPYYFENRKKEKQ